MLAFRYSYSDSQCKPRETLKVIPKELTYFQIIHAEPIPIPWKIGLGKLMNCEQSSGSPGVLYTISYVYGSGWLKKIPETSDVFFNIFFRQYYPSILNLDSALPFSVLDNKPSANYNSVFNNNNNNSPVVKSPRQDEKYLIQEP